MKIKGIVWGGTKTNNYDVSAKFFRDVLNLTPLVTENDVTIFKLPNGDLFEVIGPTQAVELNGLVSGPKIDFLVDDVDSARTELEKQGVEFIGPILRSSEQNWTHFMGPDGFVYGLTDLHTHPAQLID